MLQTLMESQTFNKFLSVPSNRMSTVMPYQQKQDTRELQALPPLASEGLQANRGTV